ncbi:hypothetical protein [Methylorubrum extorquens]|jgi:hypothetical protein|uniref:Uncharacterized protein n=1 Tax=Methylorubrum extorquens (strain ATCC 14718 / DSM 1338 / JCM 2805 / NCIMB 9133 / AM1) TaxID=272630 RepID=C5AZT9_METEA|nr:hypothetical protein [Methylorubrum extorquens]ACS41463.1 Hypothetical protein MexAM1_META1p3753 [Methylorubrum extorquens AM1]MCP1540358.1 hypothetical protein [Methylorubrum extorquens]MCP1587105.1 hypothetical protein [Methylorubrum extorquens]
MARYRDRREAPDYTHLRGKSPEQVFAETYARRAPGEHSGWWPERVNRTLIGLIAERETLHVREAAAVYGALFAKPIHTPEFTADRAANLLAWGVRLGILTESVEAGRYVWRMPDRELMWETDPKGRARQIRGLPDGEQADMNRRRAAQDRAADTRARKSAAALAPDIERAVDALLRARPGVTVPDTPDWREALPNALLPCLLVELRPMLLEAHHAMDPRRQRQWLHRLHTSVSVHRCSRSVDTGRPPGERASPLVLDPAPAPAPAPATVHVPDLEDLCEDDAAALAGL